MGCVSSKDEVCDNNPHMYRVINIDANGTNICTGDMAINRAELTLYCANCEPMHWPLNGLRRYGCDASLFTFEAGRHCQSVAGVYAFRCRRAEQLYLTLQMYIQNPSRSVYSEPYMRQTQATGPAVPIVRSTAAGAAAGMASMMPMMVGGGGGGQLHGVGGGLMEGDGGGGGELLLGGLQQRSLLMGNSPNRGGGSTATVAALQSMAQTRSMLLLSSSYRHWV